MHKQPSIYYPLSVYLPADIERELFINRDDKDSGTLTDEDKEVYDRTTLFYDIFLSTDKSTLICIGPPFLNLGEPYAVFCGKQEIQFTLSRLISRFVLVLINIEQINWKNAPQLSMHFESFKISFRIPSPQSHISRHTDVMLSTLQKDNSTNLIKQWCDWYNQAHGVARIIIYDNGSSVNYDLQQLRSELTGQKAEILLVHWPFPYGPVRSNPNQYTQVGSLNHCRLLFGHHSQWVINLDIDEYLYVNSPISLGEYLSRPTVNSRPVIYMDSYMLYTDNQKNGEEPCLFDHHLRYPYRRFWICRKYIYQPQKITANYIHTAVLSLSHLSFFSLIKYRNNELWRKLKEQYRFIKEFSFLLMKAVPLKESLFFFHLQDLKIFWKQESELAAKTRKHRKAVRFTRDNRLRETAKKVGLVEY